MRYLKLILVIICVFAIKQVNAQAHYEPRVGVGAKGGMTLSRTMFSPQVPQSFIMGYMGGLTFRYSEEKHFGLLVELNMQQRGWKEDFEDAPFNYSRQFTYLQMPVMTHIFFGSTKVRGFFNLGPEIAYMIDENVSTNFDVNNIKNLEGFPYYNRHNEQLTLAVKNKIDYGISAGAGIEFIANMKHSFMLEGRFYYGLGNAFGSNKKDAFSASTGMSLMVTLGYMYRIK